MKTTNASFFLTHAKHFGSLFFTGLIALGIVILLEVISHNHNVFFDLTPGQIFTFSEQTQNVLNSLEKDVEFISFYRASDRDALEDFFKRLCDFSKRLKYRMVDLDRNPGKARMYGVSHVQTVIKYDGNTRVIGYATEERVVNAILKLSRGIVKSAYFTKGHDENLVFSDLKKALETENWNVRQINLLEHKDISTNETVVVAVNPKKDFMQSEISVFEQYLSKGGQIMLLIEPFTALPNLKAFLKKYRIALGDGIVVDRQSKLSGGDYLTPLVTDKFKCPVTQGLGPSSSFLFPTVRPVEVMEDGADDIRVYPLARTSRNSWTKSDKEEVKQEDVDFKEGIDTPGPLVVAAWARVQNNGGDTEGELICIGDSDFIMDRYYDTFANKDLFLNCMNWLAKDRNLISIRSKNVEFPYHFLSSSQGWMLFWVSIVLLPTIFLVIGIVLFIFRRVRG